MSTKPGQIQILVPQSVEEGEYLVFSVDGKFMSVGLDGRSVVVEPSDANSRFEPQVRHMILAYLRNFSGWEDGYRENATIAEVVQLATRYYRGGRGTRR